MLHPTVLNNKTICAKDGFVQIAVTDKIQFLCIRCTLPHLFYVVLPAEEVQVCLQRDALI